MTNEDLARIRTIVDSKEFFDPLVRLCMEEAHERLNPLRSAVRQGNTIEAAQFEAAMKVFDDLPEIIERYASKFRTPSTV